MPALVTVLIPAYNAASTITRALDSVFRQQYDFLEVIVVNDASSDNTAAVVKAYPRPEIRLFSLPSNHGECGAMNYGLQMAKGDYVAFLDADDEWLDNKLTQQLQLLESNEKLSFVSCGCLFVDQYGAVRRQFGAYLNPSQPDQVWRGLLAATSIAKPCVVARRTSLSQVGLFDPKLAVAGDQDMWIRLALAGDVDVVPQFLVKAYDTPNSLTKKYAARVAEFVLPMITRHIAEQRARLNHAEITRILCERYSSIGRDLYVTGNIWSGAKYLAKAILKGHAVRQNAWYLMTASPLSRWIKMRFVSGSS